MTRCSKFTTFSLINYLLLRNINPSFPKEKITLIITVQVRYFLFFFNYFFALAIFFHNSVYSVEEVIIGIPGRGLGVIFRQDVLRYSSSFFFKRAPERKRYCIFTSTYRYSSSMRWWARRVEQVQRKHCSKQRGHPLVLELRL